MDFSGDSEAPHIDIVPLYVIPPTEKQSTVLCMNSWSRYPFELLEVESHGHQADGHSLTSRDWF